MPIIRDIPLSLKTREVLRREGFGGHSKVRPEIKSLVLELLASVKKAHLLEPAVAYEIYTITEMSHRQLSLEGDLVVQGPLLPSLLPKAKELAVVVCTIGPRLEKQVTDYINRDEPLRGLLLDGIGSAAVDSLTQEVCKFMAGEASSRGYQASSPISPGMPGLPITEQWRLLEMVPAREIGASLTPLAIMSPRKSTSMVMGLGPQMTRWTGAEVCAHCSLRKTCPYRIPA
ncbi:unnamed protein product [marine sediment metagenome]|uniref:AdoMet activation domain-containing protein n=1 Tax=marine sediment metagenome TaxID=412755 RepID=X1GX37_9ZZZZ